MKNMISALKTQVESVQSDLAESSIDELEGPTEKLSQKSQEKKKKEVSVTSKHLTFCGNHQEIITGTAKQSLQRRPTQNRNNIVTS